MKEQPRALERQKDGMVQLMKRKQAAEPRPMNSLEVIQPLMTTQLELMQRMMKQQELMPLTTKLQDFQLLMMKQQRQQPMRMMQQQPPLRAEGGYGDPMNDAAELCCLCATCTCCLDMILCRS